MRQFARFSVVGLSGFVVDFGVFNLLYWGVPFFHTWYLAANVISFSLAVTNNFFWHKRWTFRDPGQQAAEAILDDGMAAAGKQGPAATWLQQHGGQFSVFVLVSLIGLGLNTSILKVVSQQPPVQAFFGKQAPNFAKIVATGIVWFWNFGANKLWTFRKG